MRTALGFTVVSLLGAMALSGLCLGQVLSSPPSTSAPPPRDWSYHPAPPLPAPPTHLWVHLNGSADLEHLRATNFRHYLRARQILAAANEICQPGPIHAYATRFREDYANCESMLWLTSNPPQKRLTFHLDDIGYIALVSVTVGGGKVEDLTATAVRHR
jgi:hypothetical protein